MKFLFDAITTYSNNQTIQKKFIEIEKIDKKIPQHSYKLTNSFKEQKEKNKEESSENREIRSRKAKHVKIFTYKD